MHETFIPIPEAMIESTLETNIPAKKIETAREFTKQVPFPQVVLAGLKDIDFQTLDEAIRHIPPRYLLSWLSWRYSLIVANPSLPIDRETRQESPLEKKFDGTYDINSAKASLKLPPTGFEGYFVGKDEDNIHEVAAVLLGLHGDSSYGGETLADTVLPGSLTVRNELLKKIKEQDKAKIIDQMVKLKIPTKLDSSGVATYIGILGDLSLRNIALQHRFDDPTRVNRFFKLLTSNEVNSVQDISALIELDSVFGSMIGRLRSLINGNKKGEAWKKQTHDVVERYIGALAYEMAESKIRERFNLPPSMTTQNQFGGDHPSWANLPRELNISLDGKNPVILNVQRGYAFASLVGKMGNPLVRSAMPGMRRIAQIVI